MAQYKVRSGQNIYDVALSIYGSVEGVFDLLMSNQWLNMETKLSYGMVLDYHEEFVINKNIAIWLKDNGILVKNGEHVYNRIDIEQFVDEHFKNEHSELQEALSVMSPDEQNMFWETLYTPRMIIQQQGQLSSFRFKLIPDKHIFIDWGDYSGIQIAEEGGEKELEHCYKGTGKHIITLYGDFEFDFLDMTNINGVYYPLGTIYANEFVSSLNIEDLKKLIIPL